MTALEGPDRLTRWRRCSGGGLACCRGRGMALFVAPSASEWLPGPRVCGVTELAAQLPLCWPPVEARLLDLWSSPPWFDPPAPADPAQFQALPAAFPTRPTLITRREPLPACSSSNCRGRLHWLVQTIFHLLLLLSPRYRDIELPRGGVARLDDF